MPAVITHDFFGQDVYKTLHDLIGDTRDEYHAFLLGCQGPDAFFYSMLVPRLRPYSELGLFMHASKPIELLYTMKQSLSVLDPQEAPIGRAYVFGFLCHYLLDSTMHPFVYWQERRLCDAGVEGLDRKNKMEVHAVIECELDEIVLFVKKHQTVAQFSPKTEILRGSDFVLAAISKMHAYMALVVYGITVPHMMFASSIRSFRRIQAVFHSRTGFKREAIGRIEELFRPYSFVRSMSPRPVEATTNGFDNHEHAPWTCPFTGKTSNTGFWDLYWLALGKVNVALKEIDREGFDLAAAARITNNINFSGEPTVAILTVEETVAADA
ncbi:MAG: zinc dependent phospholipase C family protein [Eggerthellaceae bacterium]|nr:zinc dependent phospholipase C family protein [Eggerthellaceae bacterium]